MYFGAAAIVAGGHRGVRYRSPNLPRTVCESMEDVYLPLQLSEQQIQTLASEFTEWQGRCLVRTDSAKIYVLR